MSCRLIQLNPNLWEVQYQNSKVAEIGRTPRSDQLCLHYGSGSGELAACEVEFVTNWAKEQITLLNITRKLTR